VWFSVEGEEGQQSGVGKNLSEAGLEDVFPLVDLVAVGTGVLSVCPVLVITRWFVFFQKRHYLLPYSRDKCH